MNEYYIDVADNHEAGNTRMHEAVIFILRDPMSLYNIFTVLTEFRSQWAMN